MARISSFINFFEKLLKLVFADQTCLSRSAIFMNWEKLYLLWSSFLKYPYNYLESSWPVLFLSYLLKISFTVFSIYLSKLCVGSDLFGEDFRGDLAGDGFLKLLFLWNIYLLGEIRVEGINLPWVRLTSLLLMNIGVPTLLLLYSFKYGYLKILLISLDLDLSRVKVIVGFTCVPLIKW